MEKSLEALEGMQRQGQDIVDRLSSLAQGFSGLVQGHMRNPHPDLKWLPWLPKDKPKSFNRVHFTNNSSRRTPRPSDLPPPVVDDPVKGANIAEFGKTLGQAGAEFGARVGGIVQNVVNNLPRGLNNGGASGHVDRLPAADLMAPGHMELKDEREEGEGLDELVDNEEFEFKSKERSRFQKNQGSVTITATYDSRTQDVESSVVARGDKWRAEVSIGGSSSGNTAVPLFLLQLCPFFFVRDTLLLPIHSSDQHRLWYGFDKKNGLHSLCPVIWSKHSRWHILSMMCLNPLTCTFMDLHFPNGQLTYAAGEGLTTSVFIPAFGGLLQTHCRFPGAKKISFSRRNRRGACVTPAIQWPDKSFSIRMVQPLAWQWTGFTCQPTTQLSVTPTFGGRNAGWNAELIHTIREKLSFTCGCALTIHPSVFASVSVNRSKKNGNFGSSGFVFRVESPLEDLGRTSFSIQLSSGVEF